MRSVITLCTASHSMPSPLFPPLLKVAIWHQWLKVRRQAAWGRPNAKVDRHWIAIIFRTHFPSHAKKSLRSENLLTGFWFPTTVYHLSVPLRFPTWCGLESTFWSDSKVAMPCWEHLLPVSLREEASAIKLVQQKFCQLGCSKQSLQADCSQKS